jgi:hypothetical protein
MAGFYEEAEKILSGENIMLKDQDFKKPFHL